MGFIDTPPAPAPGVLALDGAPATSAGSDAFGAFAATTLRWLATASSGAVARFATTFRVYGSGRAIAFEQSIPAGAWGTAYRNATLYDRGVTLVEPFLHFPAFKADGPDAASDDVFARGAGWTTWQGTQISRGFLPAGAGAPPADKLGLDSGPVVVFETQAQDAGQASTYDAAMLAPVSHFKGAVQVRSTQDGGAGDWVAGVSGEVQSVPAGYSHATMLFAGRGVTDTVLAWGELMRDAFNTTQDKVEDIVAQKVGYWTDKGGIQGVKCVDRWALPEDTFPGGLDALRREYGAPFLLYGPYFCTENQWNQTLVPSNSDAGVPFGRDASEAFYTRVFDYARAHGGFAYEVDFMNELYLGVPEFRRELDAATAWQEGMNAAAARTGLRVQFCMMHPSDLLSTLRYSHVTNGRASPDYAGGANWFIGHSSLLFEAVGLKPSKDNFWSADGQARQPGFKQANPGTNGELNAILATMSTGPVGPADGAGQHNATRLRRAMGADGRILGTARPLTPADAVYASMAGGQRQINAAALWTANSHPVDQPGATGGGAQLSWHVLGVDVQPTSADGGLAVLRSDLHPAPPAAQLLAVRDFHRAARCTEGADAVRSGCLTGISRGGSDPALLSMDRGVAWPAPNTHTVQLYTVSPLVAGKWALLGELAKFVPVSHARFGNVAAGAARVSAALAGAPGEHVNVTALQPGANAGSWTVATQTVTIGNDGTGRFY
eukprot:g149.t1